MSNNSRKGAIMRFGPQHANTKRTAIWFQDSPIIEICNMAIPIVSSAPVQQSIVSVDLRARSKLTVDQ